MGDYNFYGLTTRSFEQLVQSLCLRFIGPGCTIFGDGPDGGREATFEGRSKYPSASEGWDGYWVFQAKFLQKPVANPQAGCEWLRSQISKEVSVWLEHPKRKRPDYYIIATNVHLSGVEAIGGKDVLDDERVKWAELLGAKAVHIWDGDRISRFLDDSIDIRRAYAAWVTAGDVLSALLRNIEGDASSLETVLHNYLQKDLVDDAYARLEQAGDQSDAQIPLARVFIDLPANSSPLTGNIASNQSPDYPRIVEHLINLGNARLSPSCLPIKSKGGQARIVLIGGPGQGKTTVGQFLCQLYRAAILKTRQDYTLAPQALDALGLIVSQVKEQDLHLPSSKRFPIRIVLASLAKWLSGSSDPSTLSVLSYICDQINARSITKISSAQLMAWMASTPWLLVLDGLDEVPAASNRDHMMQAIGDFLIDVRSADFDGLVVATTRPQGYNEEFSPDYYTHLWLSNLSEQEALRYGSKLVRAKFGPFSSRTEIVVDRLRKALSSETTRRLMTTPLQVTIMTALVEHAGSPPNDRWRLFHQFYEVIYRREQEKSIPISPVLAKYKTHIDAIHYIAGFLLQYSSEGAGATDATLSYKVFEKIAEKWFSNEGYRGEKLDSLVKSVSTAATDRLVFLVSPADNEVGFEIRSLQEFMAAQCLTGAGSKLAIERIDAVVPHPFWRNTFLFAAGRCFAEGHYLRNSLHGAIVAANSREGSVPYDLVLYGSRLALDLLLDGALNSQPKYERLLLAQALHLVSLPPNEGVVNLATLYQPEYEHLYKNAVREGSLDHASNGCLLLALALAGQEVSWAVDEVESWERLTAPESRITRYLSFSHFNVPEVYRKIRALRPYASFQDYAQFIMRFEHHLSNPDPIDQLLVEFMHSPRTRRAMVINDPPLGHRVDVSFAAVDGGIGEVPEVLVALRAQQAGWSSFAHLVEFECAPTKANLVAFIESFRGRIVEPAFGWIDCNWVAGSVIRGLVGQSSLDEMLELCASGSLGDINDWQEIEEDISANGIFLEQYLKPDERFSVRPYVKEGFAYLDDPEGVDMDEYVRTLCRADDLVGRLMLHLAASAAMRQPIKVRDMNLKLSDDDVRRLMDLGRNLPPHYKQVCLSAFVPAFSAELGEAFSEFFKGTNGSIRWPASLKFSDQIYDYLRLGTASGSFLASIRESRSRVYQPFPTEISRFFIGRSEYVQWEAFLVDLPVRMRHAPPGEIVKGMIETFGLREKRLISFLNYLSSGCIIVEDALEAITCLVDSVGKESSRFVEVAIRIASGLLGKRRSSFDLDRLCLPEIVYRDSEPEVIIPVVEDAT
ncbi:MAG: NACHT domain-containing protein [Fimbriimonas sp.]